MLVVAALAAIGAVIAFLLVENYKPAATPPPGTATVTPTAVAESVPIAKATSVHAAERTTPPAVPRAPLSTPQLVPAPTPFPEAAQPAKVAAASLDGFLAGGGDAVHFTLPSGEVLNGRATRIARGDQGAEAIEGNLTATRAGTFSFERIVLPDGTVALKGLVMFESGKMLYRLESRDGLPVFVEQTVP